MSLSRKGWPKICINIFIYVVIILLLDLVKTDGNIAKHACRIISYKCLSCLLNHELNTEAILKSYQLYASTFSFGFHLYAHTL